MASQFGNAVKKLFTRECSSMPKIGFTHLSKHAACRLKERTVFKENEIVALLDSDLYVRLGVETGFEREHCLIYCEIKNEYYVAVRDIKCGTVITVLPLNFHQNLSWKLDRSCLTVNSESLRRARTAAVYKIKNGDMPFYISLKVRYITTCGKLKTATMKKFSAAKYGYNPERILENQNKIQNLFSRWLRKNNPVKIVDIISSMGRTATPRFCADVFVEELNEKFGLFQMNNTEKTH